ncbi:MAG: hypothetical protein K6C41_01695 [Lachnospiraceae bacterium]|nr:hypothetical protein [Lachnospiraceae bacterium]
MEKRKTRVTSEYNKPAMVNAHKAQVDELGKPISDALYKELRDYANKCKIKISGFRNYVGDIETIKTVIDDISEIAEDFPQIIDERNGVVLELDFDMKDEDFATTGSGHVIHLNASYFCNLGLLKKAYSEAVDNGDFVAGTDWRAICRHETGHVVANTYRIDSLSIIMELLTIDSKAEIFYRLSRELSIYSASYNDGREIISESFSGYYSKVENAIASAFVNRCLEMRRAGDHNEGL